MAAAATLLAASQQAWDNLAGKTLAGTVKANILAFCNTADPLFPLSNQFNIALANWLTVLRSFASSMTNQTVFGFSTDGLATSAPLVYRLCALADLLSNQGAITAPQATALLAAYNANF